MNWANVHIAINHVPVIGALIGFLLLAYAAWRRSPEVQRVTLGLLVLVGLSALAAFLTGDPALDVLTAAVPALASSASSVSSHLSRVSESWSRAVTWRRHPTVSTPWTHA
jgi:hypothetical protein